MLISFFQRPKLKMMQKNPLYWLSMCFEGRVTGSVTSFVFTLRLQNNIDDH